MMDEGYVWIATNSISSVIETLDLDFLDSMQGLIGFRPYVPGSLTKSSFISRFKTKFHEDHPQSEISTPTLYELWAYDTAWLVSMAAEQMDKPKFGDDNLTYFNNFIVREKGKGYLDAIGSTELDGLSGKFRFVDGQLQLSIFEVVNVIGKGVRVVGFWTPESGISGTLNSPNTSFKGGLKSMKTVVWPGDTLVASKGFATRLSEKILQIAVPRFANRKFVDVMNKTNATGYCIDVFNAVMQKLPTTMSYEYITVPIYDTYDNLIDMVVQKDFDAVVGDVTILANRSHYVDFSFSFVETGISMLVPKRDYRNAWIFLKPLETDLWIASFFFFFFTGFVIWLIKHRINPEFRGTPTQQLGITFYLAFSTLVFSHKEKLESNLSRFAMIVWLFVVLVLTSSYTASFTSILTVQQLQATTNVNELIRQGYYVGYQSYFVRNLLLKLGFDSRKLIILDSSGYDFALNTGSAYGGVAAIFDEIPYIKLFLSDHCADNYAMVGPIYESNGFGFVFPKGSPLVPDVSSAILSLKDTGEMETIRHKWFHNLSASCQNVTSDYLRLSFGDFAGLFIITGLVSGLMLVTSLSIFIFNERDKLKSIGSSESTTLKKLLAWLKFYDQKDSNSPAFRKHNELLQSSGVVEENGDMTSLDGTAGFELVHSASSRSSSRAGSFQGRTNQ